MGLSGVQYHFSSSHGTWFPKCSTDDGSSHYSIAIHVSTDSIQLYGKTDESGESWDHVLWTAYAVHADIVVTTTEGKSWTVFHTGTSKGKCSARPRSVEYLNQTLLPAPLEARRSRARSSTRAPVFCPVIAQL